MDIGALKFLMTASQFLWCCVSPCLLDLTLDKVTVFQGRSYPWINLQSWRLAFMIRPLSLLTQCWFLWREILGVVTALVLSATVLLVQPFDIAGVCQLTYNLALFYRTRWAPFSLDTVVGALGIYSGAAVDLPFSTLIYVRSAATVGGSVTFRTWPNDGHQKVATLSWSVVALVVV